MTRDEKIAIQKIDMPGVPLNALLDSIAKQGEQYIADGHEHASQLFLLRKVESGLTPGGDGYAVEIIAVAPMPGDQEGKDLMAAGLGHLVAPYDAYIFLTEAWVVAVKSRDAIDDLIGKVKDHGRKEIFQLHFVSKLGESIMRDWEIIRPEHSKAHFGERRETTQQGQLEGRFVNFYLWARAPGEPEN